MIRLQKIIKRCLSYTQGQHVGGAREYFYYIDHQGMLFLDDSRMKNFTSCFKEKKFLVFFFKNLKMNDTERHINEFPYLSLCGRERNFVRCDDYPIVFTNIIEKDGSYLFSYNHTGGDLFLDFRPERLCMCPSNGRIYHPASERVGGVGLVTSKLAIELSKNFIHENGEEAPPTKFKWKDRVYETEDEWFNTAKKSNER